MKTITSSPAGKATWILALGCSLTLLLAGCRDREVQEMDRVAGLAFRSIAAHQVTLGRDALMDGDGRMAGALIRETAHALEAGFQRAHIDLGNAMTQKLRKAREVGLRMQLNGDGTRVEGLEVLDNLDSAVTALGNTITNRRK